MRQLLQIFFFDVRSNMKSFMGAYMVIVPAVILIVLRFFLPSVESTSATVAVVTSGPNAVSERMVGAIDEIADIAEYESIEAMENRLRGTGSVEGLYWDPEARQHVSVLERTLEANTAFSVAARVVRQEYLRQNYPNSPRVTKFTSSVPAELSDRTEHPPVATMGGSIFLAFMGVIVAFMLGLSVVNDKEYGTDRAIRVSPVTRAEYYIGKSLFPLIILLVYPIIAVAVLGLWGTSIAMIYVAVACSYVIALLIGLLLGALAKNETEAMGVGKTVGMVVMLAILGGALLPDGWQWVTYWIPVYWLFDMIQDVLIQVATWGEIGWKSAIMVGSTAVYFLLLRRRIAAGLS